MRSRDKRPRLWRDGAPFRLACSRTLCGASPPSPTAPRGGAACSSRSSQEQPRACARCTCGIACGNTVLMPRLRDLPRATQAMGWGAFLKKVYVEIDDDNLWTWASALAYSWLFAIFPFFLVLLSLIPTLKYEWRVEAKNQINNAINQLPHDAKIT